MKTQKVPTTLTQQELANMKRTMFEMLRESGKLEISRYEDLATDLDGLSFADYSLDDYAIQLKDVVQEMINLDDLAFDIGQLYKFLEKLS
jgi:hypothetical protein